VLADVVFPGSLEFLDGGRARLYWRAERRVDRTPGDAVQLIPMCDRTVPSGCARSPDFSKTGQPPDQPDGVRVDAKEARAPRRIT
jgi:hypothetical protein